MYAKHLLTSTIIAFSIIISGCGDKSPQPTNQTSNLSPLQVVDWGPRETKKGVPANPQPDGVSAIWIGVKGLASDPKTVVKYDGKIAVPASVQPELVTAPVPKELIDKVGEYLVTIEEPTGRRTTVGTFKVLP